MPEEVGDDVNLDMHNKITAAHLSMVVPNRCSGPSQHLRRLIQPSGLTLQLQSRRRRQ